MLRLFLLILPLCLFWAPPALAMNASDSPDSDPLKLGAAFPDLPLQGVLTDEQAKYLGFNSASEHVTLDGLQAPTVIVQIFSMYCPFCQAEAQVMVDLYTQINSKGHSDEIKLIGVGAGNSQVEVDVFRNKYNIPFPLFIDPEFKVHSACGKVGTPFIYLLQKDTTSGKYNIIHTQLGQLESSAGDFLEKVLLLTK